VRQSKYKKKEKKEKRKKGRRNAAYDANGVATTLALDHDSVLKHS
jgi:hypothetical protein